MAEQRLIDGEQLFGFLSDQLVKEKGSFSQGINKGLNIARSAIHNVDAVKPIDPETLPIVRQLREELKNEIAKKQICGEVIERLDKQLEEVTADRDELEAICGKLVALCDQPKEWQLKLFRRHRGPMIGDYMGSGYPFVDAFNRIFDEFEETASEGAYQAVRKAADKEAKKR